MTIYVDTREPPEVRSILKSLGYRFVVKKLDAGDLETPKCVFERKDISDLFQSMRGYGMRVGGRLFDQMDRLAEYCEERGKEPFLLIVGSVEDLKRRLPDGIQINEDAIYGAVASVICRYGVNVLWIERGLATALYVALKLAQKVAEGKRYLPHRYSFRKVHRDKRVAHVANVLRISPRIAERLVRKFGGLRGILNASDHELLLVDGIGPATVARIRALLGD